ncbi:MAG: sugar ABC transporter ATP-binding protein [Paludibacterium sp.]|uniref:sugar ABC transporter ATP-binding protein n=1 Tax=Paludibacterium sp. TaxID=1917523 RepID=UPI0025D19D1D|nr:sugar ABC transporter ATP-binding protein [Paludibacterium sp.]MBV8048763.1 sugar ABC transporter ATP-binding protein [Paludibacterium sp.]MBV8646319.1 sugar ABC transporter ATP-binding protein [Paludibacterium sp.]
MPDHAPILRLRGIGKTYATPVLADIDLALVPGETLALTGENGAGKSTLSKIVAGLIPPTQGEMQLLDQPYRPASRSEAEALGIRMVMQELSLVPTLTVAENLFLGHLPQRGGFIRRQTLFDEAAAHMKAIGLDRIDPRQLVGELGIGHQQMVEIARALLGPCRLLILDEPTAMLTKHEIEHLFRQIERLKAEGVSIVYISHRLDEVEQIADRVTVLRDGRHVATRPMTELTQEEIVRLMVGHDVAESAVRPPLPPSTPALRIEGLGRGTRVRDVSLDLHPGEIYGIAGLVGSGRTELLRLLFGADQKDHGNIFLRGSTEAARITSPMSAVRQGIGLIPEDRKSQGLLLDKSITLNTTLARLTRFARRGWLNLAGERTAADNYVQLLGIRCNSAEQSTQELSGGNQQKVVLARWMLRDCDILLLDEPTRGVDIGARADIYAQMRQMADAGKALLVVSSDLRELMEICDRIGVMSAGRWAGSFARGQWDQQTLLEAAFSGYSNRPQEVKQG